MHSHIRMGLHLLVAVVPALVELVAVAPALPDVADASSEEVEVGEPSRLDGLDHGKAAKHLAEVVG